MRPSAQNCANEILNRFNLSAYINWNVLDAAHATSSAPASQACVHYWK